MGGMGPEAVFFLPPNPPAASPSYSLDSTPIAIPPYPPTAPERLATVPLGAKG